MSQQSTQRRSGSGIRLPLWGLGLLALAILVFLLISSIWLFRTVRRLASDWEVTDPEIIEATEPGNEGQSPINQPLIDVEAGEQPIMSTEAFQPWSGKDRVTILGLGIDQRCDEEGPTRTDTMMLFTMDPVGKTAAILSLPRDLWIEVPGFGVDKINRAHFLGEIYEYPGGGPALAVETVEAALGIQIDYYATVNFEAFVQLVDRIGGIDIEVPEEIQDRNYPDNCYGYDPFFIEAGRQHLDGEAALKYARTRATFGGDVDRAGRQQAVIMAIRNKILNLGMAPQLLASAPELWRVVQDNVRTDLTLSEIIQLALFAQDISRESVRNIVIGYEYVYNETTPDGQDVLVPDREKLRSLRQELFAPPALPTPEIRNLPQLMVQESARIAILNGTPVFGLAGATQTYLQSLNFNVVEIGNADSSEYRTTQVIDYGSNPGTTRYLIQIMDIPPLNITTGTRPTGDFDVLIVLGADWQVPDDASQEAVAD